MSTELHPHVDDQKTLQQIELLAEMSSPTHDLIVYAYEVGRCRGRVEVAEDIFADIAKDTTRRAA